MNEEHKPEQPETKRREIPATILGVGLMVIMILGMLAWVALLVAGQHAGVR